MDCPEIICYKCGKAGHMSFFCPQPNEERAAICWTCKGLGHKRNDRECPGAKTLFCSYCFTSGISTEMCPCNDVNTKNLKRFQKVSNIKTRLGGKTQTQASENQWSKRVNYGKDPFPCGFSVQVGIQSYGAFIDPNSRRSWINPDLVYVAEYNGIDHFLRTSVTIHEIQRDITFEIDISMSQHIILGVDAILAFDIKMTVGGRELTRIRPENLPKIIKKPSETRGNANLFYLPFKNPINLNLALTEAEEANISSIPMGEFLERIDDVIDDEEYSSADEGTRKSHPNRRLHRE